MGGIGIYRSDVFFLGVRLAPYPFIVRDESGRLFLDIALQRISPLHRPSLIVQQIGNTVNLKWVLTTQSRPARQDRVVSVAPPEAAENGSPLRRP